MIRPLIALAIVTAVPTPTPKPPQVCLPDPVMEAAFCPNSDTTYVFTETVGCEAPKLAFHNCDALPVENPDDIAEPAPIEPGYDEHDPTGPGEGPEGAGTVDRPDVP